MNIIFHDLSKEIHFKIKRGSYINALVLLNLLMSFGNKIIWRLVEYVISF